MPLNKIRAVFIDTDGKKTEDQIVIEVLVNNKGQPDFKGKSELFGYCKWYDQDANSIGTFPYVGVASQGQVTLDFGDSFLEENETPINPKGGRYMHLLTEKFGTSAGQQLIVSYSGEKHPYQIVKVTKLALGGKSS